MYGAIIFVSVILASCGQNDNKQKELELKERELALKEKEFALKQKDSTVHQTTSSTKAVEQISVNDAGQDFLGEWKYKDEFKTDAFLKITKDKKGKFNIQKGHKNGDKINWGNMDFSIGTGINLKFSSGKLVGKYRNWEGSAPDAYSDISIAIKLTSSGSLLFKSDYESFEATKIK